MGKQLDNKETVDIKELLMSEVIQTEALVNILERKGILTKQELMDEIVSVHKSMVDTKQKRK
jgi:hypothetical protein